LRQKARGRILGNCRSIGTPDRHHRARGEIGGGTHRTDEVAGTVQHLAHQNVDVVIVPQSAMLISQTQQIADSALAKRLPTVYGYREHVVDDGLISYGVDSPASVSKKGGILLANLPAP